MHTSLLAVERDPPGFVFEQGPDTELNKRVLGTPQITLVTSDHGIPVQFTCQKPRLTEFEGTAAFSASLPDRVLRLQRRGFYRLQGQPLLPLLKCRILREDQAETKLLAPSVMDLSCGGISVAVPNTEAKLEPGSRHKCTLELATAGKIDVAVVVHASREISLPDGVEAHRYGIEFVNLDGKSTALIQRYIADEERSRAKKASR
jgi:c-di-GMP-binding flagellar brake protein YcgR